ncbi:PHD FINGER-CONTAINING PROTEIN [Salix purpurea]|uniref:PHD FINGER-CONTAINING PROTEIN n=1 Tax=Salix purpurea TaxID=77065 RepID=A0A9Q0VUT8_SALPP|nr:PHD FINGER-CONTAINING PROTEIN [Salix purpurea]
MASSDEEADTLPESVSTYHFANDKDEPISFSLLPIRWRESKNLDDEKNHMIFLKGSVDNGLRTIYKQVIAWKFDLSNKTPQISVLTKEKCWMELGKPRKSYEIIIRTVLITVHCLHFARWNPEASGKSVWDYLSKTFSLYEHRPSQNDLVDHLDLIGEAVQKENSLAKCKFLLNFLEEKPRKKMSDEDFQATAMSAFIVDDVEDDNFEDLEEDESNDEDELFDSVCAFCDNGGNILCCEGSCLRSFHATAESGEESACESLGFTNREVEVMQSFFCKNCKFKQHQCFACGKLGSSDKFSGAEVFRCANATCGHFYHPHCAATLLHREDKVAAEELQKKIAAGESFACPIHKCCICKLVEDKKKSDLQFAVCRRCPTSYHKKCLPKEIVFENEADDDTIARAWQNLLPNRILIYCLKHNIIEGIGTPVRDHIRFPDVGEKKSAAEAQKRRQTSERPANVEEGLSKKRRLTSEESYSGTFRTKASKEMSSSAKIIKITTSEKISSESNSLRKMRMNNPSRKTVRENTKSGSSEVERSTTANENKTSLGDKLYASMTNDSGNAKLRKPDVFGSELDISLPSLDADTERRLLALVKEAASSITLEDVIKKHEVPSTHAHSSKNVVDKNITLGKVEGTVEAVRTAIKKLEEKCSIEDAKAVCEPDVLNQVFKWKNKLRVYLAPFLYGMRYTSFGRHFTKVEKLMEIADILHWYVENGDMIVDFCCGANDFSCIMNKKLEEMGKRCLYKNYDVIQSKNDFNFEKRDWMTVCPDELPKKGSQLIMGLNPPFGVKAALANKFIDRALQFKPKLLILIVPPETERLDKKKPYDLVWKDDRFLSGKSFYLPGSVNENEKQMDQWNLTAPPLYLWSRQDWSAKHKAIAQKHGHPFRQQEISNLEKKHRETKTPAPVNDQYNNAGASLLPNYIPLQSKRPEESNCGIVNDGHKGRPGCNSSDREGQDSHCPRKSHSDETSRKKRQGEKMVERGTGEKSLEGRQSGGKKTSPSDYKGMHRPSPRNVDGRSSLEGSSRSVEKQPQADIGRNCYQHLDPSLSDSYIQQHRTPYGRSLVSNHDDMNRRPGTNIHESYSLDIHGLSSGGYREEHSTRFVTTNGIELDRQLPFHHYGQQGADFAQWNYPSVRDLGLGHMEPASAIPYGHLGLAAEPSYMTNVSAMQRYAPRLDELNHTRMSNLGPEPSMLNRNGSYDPRAPGAGYQFDSMGFAPGPQHPYSHHSAGWLNE